MKKILMAAIPVLVILAFVPAMAEDAALDPAASEAEIVPAEATAPAAQEEAKNIVDTVSDNADFSTLLTALKAAGWVDALKGEGPFTVFAPTNEAFAKLPKGTVEQWLKPENKNRLAAVLKHHVVKGKVVAADTKGKKTDLTTEEGDILAVDGVMAGTAKITKADIAAKNGIIHAIDTVQIPAEKK